MATTSTSISMKALFLALSSLLFVSSVTCFAPTAVISSTSSRTTPSCSSSTIISTHPSSSSSSSSALFMGRAAAVRAATKSKTDGQKAKTNALYGKKIIMAVKQGGGPNVDANTQLRDIIKQAKAHSVPVDNINRAIKRASEATVGDFSESTYEAYGYGGASMVITVLSDNANRATANVKSTITKRGGTFAEQGSVVFLYDRRGKVVVDSKELDEEELLEAAIDAGCEDMELIVNEGGTGSVVYCDPKEVAMMETAVRTMVEGEEEGGVKMGLSWVSKAPLEVSDEDFEKNMDIIDSLEELDDVDSVEHNMSN